VWASPPQPVVPNTVPDRFRPLASDNQKLAGLLINHLRANHEGFLEHIDTQLLLSPFQTKTQHASENIRGGELAGRFLQTASNAYEFNHDPRLKELMDRVAVPLISFQAKNGYFGSYADRERWTSDDLLVHKWTLLGLLSYWQATGEEDAYTASQLIGDLLVHTWGEKGSKHTLLEKDDIENAPFRLAALQTVGSLTVLYRYTADPNYLNLCKFIVRIADVNAALALSGAQENLSDTLLSLAGLADLYRLTGNKTYFSPVLRDWKALAADSLSITGTPAMDTCTTVAWMQLTLDLFRITGELQYGEHLERTIYNQLLAAQDPHTGNLASEVALAGQKHFFPKLTLNNARCMLSEAEGLTLIPQTIWGRYGDGILITTYTAGRATIQLRRRALIQIYSEASFPEGGEVLLHIEPSRNLQFPLALRVPGWTSSFVVNIDGQHLIGKTGEVVTINREWRRGDTIRISLAIDAHTLSNTDENTRKIAIQRGPQVLAFSKTLNPQIEDASLVKLPFATPSRIKLSTADAAPPPTWYGDQIYKIEGEYQGKRQSFNFVPFADAINYQVWLRKPNGPGEAER
jgi:DUF1680 family protein